MSTLMLFCTSAKVDTKAIQDLNESYRQSEAQAYGSSGFYNKLNPARSDVLNMLAPSMDPIQAFEIEVFDEPDAQLRRTYQRLMQDVSEKGVNFIQPRMFAVLDERGVQDRTLIVHDLGINFDDELDDKRYWRQWRVSWSEAYDLHVPFEFSPEIVQVVFLHADDFLDSHGVFQVKKAEQHYGYIKDQ